MYILEGRQIIEREFTLNIEHLDGENRHTVTLPRSCSEIAGISVNSQAHEDLVYFRGKLKGFQVEGREIFDANGYLVKKIFGTGAPDFRFKTLKVPLKSDRRVEINYVDLPHPQAAAPPAGYKVSISFKLIKSAEQ